MKHVHYMAFCFNGTLWIGGNNLDKLQHIHFTDDGVTVLSSFTNKINRIEILPSGSPVVIKVESNLRILNERTGQIIPSKIYMYPWILSCVHVAHNPNIIVGAHNNGKGYILVMDQYGKLVVKYENDSDSKKVFKYPINIAMSSGGAIFFNYNHIMVIQTLTLKTNHLIQLVS